MTLLRDVSQQAEKKKDIVHCIFVTSNQKNEKKKKKMKKQ